MSIAPLHVCIKPVICRAALIFIPYSLLGRSVAFAVYFHNALGTELHIRVNKNFQAIGLIAQYIVCAPADYHARTFFGYV